MASPSDYRKPRNKELRDLTWNLPFPLRVTDVDGKVIWQNPAAESFDQDCPWSSLPMTWQNKRAVLELPDQTRDPETAERLKELEEEVARLKKQQRQTARKKRQAEDSARKKEKSDAAILKKEQKLREQLEKLERDNKKLRDQKEKLKEQSEKARAEAKELRDSAKKSIKNQASQEELESLRVQVERAREEAALRLEDVDRHRQENDRQAEALMNALEQVDILERALSEGPSSGQLESHRDISDLEERVAQLQEDKKTLEAWVEELEDKLAQSKDGSVEQEGSLATVQLKLQEQLAEKVGEFEALERTLEREQDAFEKERQDLQDRLSAHEEEFRKLRESIECSPSSSDASGVELEELKEELSDTKADLQLSKRRENRLEEKLRTLEELREEHSKVLTMLKEDLQETRERERELKATVKLYSDFRREMDETREESKTLKEQVRVLRKSEALLQEQLSAQPAVPSRIDPSAETISMSSSVKNQIDFLKKRLSGTEQKLDETKSLLEKERTQNQSSKEAEKLAFQDNLTGLPNRNMVERYLNYTHHQAQATGRVVGLFLIDVNGFRLLNETYGREWGDSLLKAVGERLNGMRGASHLVARLGQDQFLLLAADIEKPSTSTFVQEASKSLLEALAYPFEVEGEEVKLTGSIGVSLGPLEGNSSSELFEHSVRALETAKRKGVSQFALYDDKVRLARQRESMYSQQMAHALGKDEFKPVFQPVFHLGKGIVLGLELLLRWEHRDQRVLKPAEFLEPAVNSGLIFSITEKIWPKAFRELAKWRKMRPGLTMSINLSDRELLNPTILKRAVELAKQVQVDPQAIIFEVRDQSRLRMSPVWWTVLQGFSKAGFGLCLDDFASDSSLFGTLAYSGFTQAKMSVQDQRAFQLVTAPQAAKGILYGVKHLQTKFDKKALAKAGFHLAQGFAVSDPLDYADVDMVLS
jgi:diguanylate cyclase (GGDEF)-like protein